MSNGESSGSPLNPLDALVVSGCHGPTGNDTDPALPSSPMGRSVRLTTAIAIAVTISGASMVFGAAGQFDEGADVAKPALRLETPVPAASTPEQRVAHALADIINVERARRGLPEYEWHELVATAATAHSEEMAANRFMRHRGNDGSNAGIRLRRAGFDWSNWGENIGAGQIEPGSLFTAWFNSNSHRPQLLGDFRHIGIGVAAAGDGTLYWTMVVAT